MHTKHKRLVLGLCCIALTLGPTGGTGRSHIAANGRAMTPEDLLTRVTLGRTVLSPDGKWAAIVVERATKVGESYARGYLSGLERTDIWLASTDGKTLLNVTRGEPVHAGHWSPVWSPDSKRLAMVSTRGGDNVRAYVYDLHTRSLRACTSDGVDIGLRIELPGATLSTIAWFDSNQLLLGVLPPGTRPLALDESERTLRIVTKGMNDVKRGRGVTASILDTEEVERSAVQEKQVTLSLIDVISNRAQALTRIPLIETRLSQRIVSISPDRAYAAVIATDYPRPLFPEGRPGVENLHPLKLGVANLRKANDPVRWLRDVRPVSFGLGLMPTAIRWAPSGSTLAFVGMPVKDVQPAAGAFTVLAQENQPRAISALKYDPKAAGAQFLTAEDIQWANSGELLVYGYAGTATGLLAETSLKDVRGFGRDNSQETARRDWWIISSPNSYHNLTREMPQSTRTLFKTRKSNAIFGASGGRLWAIDAGSRTVKPLALADTGPASIVWPRAADGDQPVEHLIISHSNAAGSDLFRVDVMSASPLSIKLGTIRRGDVFTGYSQSHQLITYETPSTEVRVIGTNKKEPVTLVSFNRQLDAIAKPEYRTFQYESSDGKQLSGALLLPYGYTPGQRYPLIVHVYGGSVPPVGDWASPHRSRLYPDPLVLAGRGYAVLIPSIPLEPMGKQSDPMLDFEKGVNPAVDKVVQMGIADPDRTGLIGFSYGGYTVCGLVTQTHRFKVAVAIAGPTDLLGFYGSLDSRYRFDDIPNPLTRPFLVEAQQSRMGVPPWMDLERYLRNSPYVHADKVTTPLLMIYGELDSIPLSQGEQLFIALNRLGKRAKLVRYLGEAHSIESPGNTLDMWDHIFNWFDAFLQNRQSNQSAKTK